MKPNQQPQQVSRSQLGEPNNGNRNPILMSYHQYHNNNNNIYQTRAATMPQNPMTISGSMVGLPTMHCPTTTATISGDSFQQQQQHNLQNQAQTCQMPQTTPTCTVQHQPIYNQIYQSLQTYHQQPTQYNQPTESFANENFSTTTMPRPQQNHPLHHQSHLFVNPIRQQQQSDIDRRLNYSLNLQHQPQYQPLQKQHQSDVVPLFSSANVSQFPQATVKSSSILSSTQFIHHHHQNVSPNNTISSSIVGGGAAAIAGSTTSTNDDQQWQRNDELKTTTNQRSKLVDSSSSTSPSSSDGQFKSYLTHLVLASNIPSAYAIILVAFLITIIAATSIITILTIVLTITGYTAYPITENTFNTSLAIGVVCASFALALVTASLVVWRRHCQAAYYYLDDPQSASRGTNSPQLSETYDDSEYGSIPVNDWAKHVQKLHVDGDIGFSREFEKIQQANSSNLSYVHSKLPENRHKNRYINIVAYDHTRVILRPLPGQKSKPGSDYINANFIDGYNKPRAYIGTQGPLVSTFDDYWRMIWEQRVVIIVMITNLQERGRRKCDMYWPKEGTETYGHVQVKLLQEVVMATYTLRTFTAKNLKMKKRNGCERTVYQYHYTNWPDHGVPDHPLPVLSFVRKSASANPSGGGAIICHCSAGCGRSGTYIVIDAMLKQVRHRQSINVVDFLKHIRSQRNYLVQTEEQYIFIHDALVEANESGETEIASNFIAKYIQLLQTGGQISQKNSTYSITNGLQSPLGQQQVLSVTNANSDGQPMANSQSNLLLANGNTVIIQNNNNGANTKGGSNATSRTQSAAGQWSLLERQYRLVASFKAKDFNVVSALKPCNKTKNRTLNLIPLEAHRVHITPKPGADGSDYINATFLMGFNHLREFIVTQHPVYETFSDFWQMVYDHNSQTIVLLTQMNDLIKEFPQFWPQKEDEVDYGSFKVKLIQESTQMKPDNGGLIITRDFMMRSNQDDYELQTRVIHCPGWPECCGPLTGVFDLIQVVQNATQQQASQQKMHDGHTTSTTVTIGQEHEPQNGGPIIVVDKFGGTEAATFAVLTTLFKQINFEDAVDVYMYAKLAHLRRPGIWSSQDDYLFLYRAIENYASSMNELSAGGNNQQASNGANASAPAINFHHQTMTLDRHKHKSSNLLKTTSTMRRGHGSGQNQAAIGGAEISKSQLLIDHNHNQLISGTLPPMQPATNLMAQRAPGGQQQRQQQQQQLKVLQNNSSPYNSAISIGTSPHQHLLAGNNGRTVSSGGVGQQAVAVDHYLYPMS